MVIYIHILRDNGVNELLVENFIESLKFEENRYLKSGKFVLQYQNTPITQSNKADIICSQIVNERSNKNIPKKHYVVFLSSTLINDQLSYSEYGRDIAIYAGDWDEYDRSLVLAAMVYNLTNEILFLSNSTQEIDTDDNSSQKLIWKGEKSTKNDYDVVRDFFNTFPSDRNRIITLLEQIISERKEKKANDNMRQKNNDIETLKLAISVIKWIYRQPKMRITDFIKIEITSNATFKYYFCHNNNNSEINEEIEIKFERKAAAYYAFFLLWCDEREITFDQQNDLDLTKFTSIYTYYDDPFSNSHSIVKRMSLFKDANSIILEINRKIEKCISEQLSVDLNARYEYYFYINKTLLGYKLAIPKPIIYIPINHKLVKDINSKIRPEIKFF